MPRPRTPLRSFGVVKHDEIRPGVWRARAYYRYPDGKIRQIERVRAGKKPAAADAALREAMTHIAPPNAQLKPSTPLRELGERFLAAKTEVGRAARTTDTYRHNLEKVIVPRLGDVSIAEASVEVVQTFLTTVVKEHGPGAAKGCRSVLSGMFGIALRRGLITSNPVAAVEDIAQPRKRASTALAPDEVAGFLAALRGDPEMQRLDMVDLFEFMLHTGCRIGEALALRWSHVDLQAAEVTFAATVVRVTGQGLILQENPKTEKSVRTIGVPVGAMTILRRREQVSEQVFPSMLGRLRDTSNTEADWRANRVRLGYPTLTSHALRKTCATALDVSGMSARAIAEYLGHKRPSMTQDVYMSRRVGGRDAAAALDRIYGVSTEAAA